MVRLFVVVAAAIALVGVVTGCGDSSSTPGPSLNWDLSRGHTRADVSWPDPQDLTSAEIRPVKSVRIALPAGHVLDESRDVYKVALDREGESIVHLQVDSGPFAPREAAARATQLARRFDLPVAPFERWRTEIDAGGARQADAAQHGTLSVAHGPARLGGRDGPEPYVKILYSADDSRPSIVSLGLDWTGG